MPMTRTRKVGLVLGGYAAAILIALLVVRLYIAMTSGPDRDASAGMFAFGDTMAFLAAFAVAAVLPTGAALYFLRSRPGFWPPLAVAAVLLALTSIVALGIHLSSAGAAPAANEPAWSAYATLWVLLAPLGGLAFLLAGLLAPIRKARLALLASASVEIGAFAVFILTWMYQATRS